jgi:LPXTG-motif cell wall-anchored protein
MNDKKNWWWVAGATAVVAVGTYVVLKKQKK